MNFKKDIVKLLKKHVKVEESLLETPPQSDMGDYALPCFSFAKELKKSPNQIAEDLAKEIQLKKPIDKVEVNGPYLNFFIDKAVLAKNILSDIYENKDYGKNKIKETVMIEYPSPNTNKPLHLGHVRNIVIGQSTSNLLKFYGNKVIQANLNNDRGVHICKSMLAYKKWGNNKDPNIKTDHFVGKYYVLFNQKAKDNPELEQEAQELLKKWEQGDKETVKLWKLMNTWAYDGFEETYANLGVTFDKYYYESDIYTKGKEIVTDGLKKGIFKEEEKAVYAELKDGQKKFLLRPDGTSIYITQDIYLAKAKFDDYKLDKSIYVVGSEQNFHFKVLFELLEMLKFKWAEKCLHLSYGMVYLPFGKMKSREGTVVDADDLIQNMIDLAKVEVRKRYKDLSDEEIEKRSKMIGLAALKFFLLKVDPGKDIHFDPKESISFEGETGPYVQYAHARICSLFKKFKETSNEDIKDIGCEIEYALVKDNEAKIIKLLSSFPDVINDSAKHYKSSVLARYLLELAQAFNEFYHNCPVLTEERKLLELRLLISHCVKVVLEKGLDILGIDAPEEM